MGGGRLVGNDSASLVGNDSASLVGNDSASLVGNDSASLVGNDSASLVGNDSASLVGNDSASLVGNDSASLVGNDSASLVGNDSASLVGNDSASLVGNDSASLVGNDSASLVGNDSASLVGNDSASLIGRDGSTVLATGRGNVIVSEAGPARARQLLSVSTKGGWVQPQRGLLLPAAGMVVRARDTYTNDLVPIGQDAQGRPVFKIYSNTRGEFELFIPQDYQGTYLIQCEPLANANPRLQYQMFANAAAPSSRVVVNEDSTAMVRYFMQGIGHDIYQELRRDAEFNDAIALKVARRIPHLKRLVDALDGMPRLSPAGLREISLRMSGILIASAPPMQNVMMDAARHPYPAYFSALGRPPENAFGHLINLARQVRHQTALTLKQPVGQARITNALRDLPQDFVWPYPICNIQRPTDVVDLLVSLYNRSEGSEYQPDGSFTVSSPTPFECESVNDRIRRQLLEGIGLMTVGATNPCQPAPDDIRSLMHTAVGSIQHHYLLYLLGLLSNTDSRPLPETIDALVRAVEQISQEVNYQENAPNQNSLKCP